MLPCKLLITKVVFRLENGLVHDLESNDTELRGQERLLQILHRIKGAVFNWCRMQ